MKKGCDLPFDFNLDCRAINTLRVFAHLGHCQL